MWGVSRWRAAIGSERRHGMRCSYSVVVVVVVRWTIDRRFIMGIVSRSVCLSVVSSISAGQRRPRLYYTDDIRL